MIARPKDCGDLEVAGDGPRLGDLDPETVAGVLHAEPALFALLVELRAICRELVKARRPRALHIEGNGSR